MTDLSLQCDCGTLKGTVKGVSPKKGNHVVCYCDDCQAFAQYVGNEEKWLDEFGGTDLFQLAPSQVEIHQGADQLRCMRVTPKGVYRFYTACCHSPIVNTISRKMPFAGIPLTALQGEGKEAAVGPVKCYVMGKFAKGTPPTNPHPKFSFASLAAVMSFVLKNKIQGNNVPTPFFSDNGHAVVKPDERN
ncbi:DUF6151 family protein [Enterovibrio norvegicus]|uniref:DUF6151 family protein n=1 Tax=Enterovibrio norvegicus TaxID=188144 RepID=UPI000C83FCDE|nr:DUF6151 family protein [Enterovibrio norvegicus]PMN72439.1 hypothetical protein BCT27_13625 [Enterovibrio norvegicus]